MSTKAFLFVVLQMSMILTQAFGKDTDAGLWTLDFVIGKLETNLSLWSSETKLVTDTAYALTTVLNNTERYTNFLFGFE